MVLVFMLCVEETLNSFQPTGTCLWLAHEFYAHLFASMGLRFLLELIVSRTSMCFILLFVFTSLIHVNIHTFCPILLLNSSNLCHSYQLGSFYECKVHLARKREDVCMPVEVWSPAGNFRKKKSNWLKSLRLLIGNISKKYDTE